MKKYNYHISILMAFWAVMVFVLTKSICLHYHPHGVDLGNEIECRLLWDLKIIMDSWGYFLLSLCLFFFTLNLLSNWELCLNMISITAATFSGNDLCDRYGNIHHFRYIWDSVMIILLLRTLYKIYKNYNAKNT